MKNSQNMNWGKGAQVGVPQKVEASGASFEMVWCPAGRFWMGRTYTQQWGYETPRHEVRISRGFWLGRTPVTQELWVAVMGENPSEANGFADGIDFGVDLQRPVECVSWYDSLRFCNKLSMLKGLQPAYELGSGDEPSVRWLREADGFQLPTEAEWEYAAKAGGEQTYAWSDELDEVAWYYSNAGSETHPVGQKAANSFGLYDMFGNVWEWCFDGWDSDAYKKRKEGATDAVNIALGSRHRVIRGGSWDNLEKKVNASYRNDCLARGECIHLGLRLCRRPLDL